MLLTSHFAASLILVHCQLTQYFKTDTPGVFVFVNTNEQATLAYHLSDGSMFITPTAAKLSTNAEDFAFTASVVVGPFHQVICKESFFVTPGPLSTATSLVLLLPHAEYVAGQSFLGTCAIHD